MIVIAGGTIAYMGFDFYGVVTERDRTLDKLESRRTEIATLERQCAACLPNKTILDTTLDCLHHLALERRIAGERSVSGLLGILENKVPAGCRLSSVDWIVNAQDGAAKLEVEGDAKDVSTVVTLVRRLGKCPPFKDGLVKYYSPTEKGITFRAVFRAPLIVKKKKSKGGGVR